MRLLEKTRQINRLLHRSERVDYSELSTLLQELLEANVYVFGLDAVAKGYSMQLGGKVDALGDIVEGHTEMPSRYMDFLLSVRETHANLQGDSLESNVVEGENAYQADKRTMLVPVYGNANRLGTVILERNGQDFNDDDILLAEYAATVVGVEILHERASVSEEELRKKAMVQIAFSTLSFSEWEAIVSVLLELDGKEGILVASKIADRVGITRSVIVNAMRKFESAGLIETKSLGMKGTYIRVKNDYVLNAIDKK